MPVRQVDRDVMVMVADEVVSREFPASGVVRRKGYVGVAPG